MYDGEGGGQFIVLDASEGLRRSTLNSCDALQVSSIETIIPCQGTPGSVILPKIIQHRPALA